MVGTAAWAQALSLPWTADFSNDEQNAQWTIINNNGDVAASGVERTWLFDGGELVMDVFSSSNDDYAFSPALNFPAGKLKLTYTVRGYSGRYSDSYDVMITTAPTVEATDGALVIESVAQNAVGSAIGVSHEVEFDIEQAGAYHVCFYDNSNDPWAVYISNVQIEVLETVTGINDIQAVENGAVQYVNMMGQVSDRPFAGVNVVVRNGKAIGKVVK